MKSNEYQTNPDCVLCPLHKEARTKSVCLKGRYHKDTSDSQHVRLLIFSDHPDYFADNASKPFSLDAGGFLDWCLARMSVDRKDVGYEYTLKCYPKQTLPTTKAGRTTLIEECSTYRFATIAVRKPHALVALGQTSLEAFTGKTRIGDHEGQPVLCWEGVVRDYVEYIWVGYSLNYILTFPSDSQSVFRSIWFAAQAAGLRPKIDPTVPPFKFRGLAFR